MSEHLDRARRYHEGIRRILLHDWDPIGVSDIAEAQDEYDGYVSKIYGMLVHHEPRHNLVEHLWSIATDNMGLSGPHGPPRGSGTATRRQLAPLRHRPGSCPGTAPAVRPLPCPFRTWRTPPRAAR